MPPTMMYILQNFHWFVLLIGALVFFHELGHFLVAKAFNVKVVKFSLGFGPKLVAFTYGETQYTISLLPLGGYVKMVGESPDELEEGEDRSRSLGARPLWQRSLVVLAGPAFNLLLALVVYMGMFIGPHTFGDTRLGIVTEGDQAWAAGIRPGDRIVAVNSTPIDRWDALREAIASHPNDTLQLTYVRGDVTSTVAVQTGSRQEQDAFDQPLSRGKMGVSLQYVLPVVAVVDPQSPAAAAGVRTGDTIVRVGNTPVGAWHEVRAGIERAQGQGTLTLEVLRDGQPHSVTIVPGPYPQGLDEPVFSAADVPGPNGYTGLVSKDVTVAQVDPNTPAARANLEVGDRLLALTLFEPDHPERPAVRRLIGVWNIDLVAFGMDTKARMTLTVQHGSTVRDVPVDLEIHDENDELRNAHRTYVFGAQNDAELMGTYTYERPVGVMEAFVEASKQVGEDMSLIGRGIGKIVQGDIPMANMGGPIMLFVIAEKSAKRGWDSFMRALAMTSVNLGLLNILPIPVLDGGHLLFFGIEAVTRRPPSVKVREWANTIGLGLLLLLMVVVFRNDVMRFLFHAR